jgi:hypothetical protein
MKNRYLGYSEIEGNEVHFEFRHVGDYGIIVSGTACNVGLLDDCAIAIESHETIDEALQELHSDLALPENERSSRCMSVAQASAVAIAME